MDVWMIAEKHIDCIFIKGSNSRTTTGMMDQLRCIVVKMPTDAKPVVFVSASIGSLVVAAYEHARHTIFTVQ